MKGKIYMLSSGNLKYCGSTTRSLNNRFNRHKKRYEAYKAGKSQYMSSFDLFDNGTVTIELLENVKCLNKRELCKQEQEYISTGIYVNRNRSYITEDERKELKKQVRERRRDLEKERGKIKISCACGGMYTYFNKRNHYNTTKHKNFLQPQKIDIQEKLKQKCFIQKKN